MTEMSACSKTMSIPIGATKTSQHPHQDRRCDVYHFLLNEAEPATNMGKPKREHISPSTIHDIHKVLRCAFNQAKKWEYIAKNPFLDATLPEHKEAKRDALTPEQLQRVLDFTDRTDIYDLYVMHCAIQLAFACCMRGGEVGGTQWERFSRSDQVLYIDRVIDRVDKKLIENCPKWTSFSAFQTSIRAHGR